MQTRVKRQGYGRNKVFIARRREMGCRLGEAWTSSRETGAGAWAGSWEERGREAGLTRRRTGDGNRRQSRWDCREKETGTGARADGTAGNRRQG